MKPDDCYDDDNVFARIIRGELPCNKVYEDDQVLAFHDIKPEAPLHILVSPKERYISFADFSNHSAGIEHFFKVVGRIAREHGLVHSGYKLIMNHGQAAGQIIPHFHAHILGGWVVS